MKRSIFALCVLPLLSFAQVSPTSPNPQMLIKGTDIAERIAKFSSADAGSLRRIDPLLIQGGYKVNLEYHTGPSKGVGLNEDAAELMVVLEGAGTISLGGTLVNPVRDGAHLQADSAVGSTPYPLKKGDAILIPQSVAHAIGPVDGRLVLMSMHIPPVTSATTVAH